MNKLNVILFLFCSTYLFGFQDGKPLLDDLVAILEDKEISTKEKENQLITCIDSINHGYDESMVGFFYYKMGAKFYLRGFYESALRFTEKAVKIKRKYKDATPIVLKSGLCNLGALYKKIDQKGKSFAAYQEVLTVDGEDLYHGKAYRILAKMYLERGDFESVLNYLEKAIQIFNKIDRTKEIFLTHSDRSRYLRIIDIEKYKDQILEDLRMCDSLIPAIKSAKKRLQYRIVINNSKGNFYSDIQEQQKAISYYEEALEYTKIMKDTIRFYQTLNNLGLTFFKNKNYEKAFRIYEEVLQNAENQNSQAIVCNNLGDYYTYLEDYEKAEDMYLRAIQIFVNSKDKVPTLEELELVPYKFDAMDYIEQTANFYYIKYTLTQDTIALKKSLSMIKLVDAIIDMIRLENKEHQSKLYWRTNGKDVYMRGVKISRLLNRPSDAFYFMEKSKVVLLLEDITDEQAKVLSAIPDGLLYKDSRFKNRIVQISEELLEIDKRKKDSIKDLLFALKRDYATFKDSLNIQFPTYAKLRKDLKIISDTEISEHLLVDSTAIVSYILHDNDGYGFIKTKEKSQLFQLKGVDNLKVLLEHIREKITSPILNEADFKSFNTDAYKAYQILFGKIENELNGIKRLIIVPDERMANIPFEVLQREHNADNPWQPKYILYDFDISYAFSVSHLKALQELPQESSKSFIGIAPVDFQNGNLTSLSNTKTEVKTISSILSGEHLLHESATKEQGIKAIESNAVVHIATHATSGENNDTCLWFYDDKLGFAELYTLKNNADMVVLSACKTFQGKEVEGEGIMSLGRGFFVSGARSVTASLWNSYDRSTQKINTAFYKYIKNKAPKDYALAQAKKDYLSSHFGSELSPCYWASSTLTGITDPIDLQEATSHFWYYGFMGLVTLVLVYRKRRRFFRSNGLRTEHT